MITLLFLGREQPHTFDDFLELPAFPCGKGAGAVFFPDLGGCH